MEALILGIIALAICIIHIDTMAALQEIIKILKDMKGGMNEWNL